MAYATDIIEDSFNRTREALFKPFNLKKWLKLGFVSFMGARQGNLNNFRLDNSFNKVSNISNFIKKWWAPLLGFGVMIGVIWSVLQSIFYFVFIDSIVKNKVEIKKSFKKNGYVGISLFLFRLTIGMIFLTIIGLLSLPLLMPLIQNFNNLSWDIISIPYLILFIMLFVVMIIFLGLIHFVVNNMVAVDMYYRNIKFTAAWKQVIKLVKKELKEVFIYFLMKIVLGIAGGILALILILPLMVIMFAFFFMVGIVGAFSQFLALPTTLIVIFVVIGFIGLLIFGYIAAVITLPIDVFFINYMLLFFNKLIENNKGLLH